MWRTVGQGRRRQARLLQLITVTREMAPSTRPPRIRWLQKTKSTPCAAMAWETFGLEANATVIEKADRESFFGLLGDALETQTNPNRPLQKAD